MNAKMTLCTLAVGALFTAAAPAYADPPRWAPAHGYRHHDRLVVVRHRPAPVVRTVIVREPVFVRRTVFVERPVYVERRPVVVHRPVVYAPAPVYPVHASGAVLGTLGGAIIGAAIGSRGDPGDQAAATVIGAVVGGVIGSQADW